MPITMRIAIGLSMLVAGAGAQTAGVLAPETFRANVGQEILVGWRTAEADGLQAAAWPDVRWMFVRSLGTQQNLHHPTPEQADAGRLRVTLDDPGATLIGLDRAEHIAEMTPAALRSFATGNLANGTEIVAQIAGPVAETLRVRRIESAKLIVRVTQPGASSAPSAAAQSKTGQVAEIRAFADPTILSPRSDFPFRTYLRGSSVGHVRVTATNETSGATTTLTTDAAGIGNVRIAAAGVWHVAWHFLERDPSADADWRLYTATLRFEVAGGVE